MLWISLRDLTESTGVLGFSGAPARSDELWIRDPSLAGIVRRVAANAVLASPSRSNRLLPQLVPRSRANPMACFGDRCSFPSRWLMSKSWVLRTTLSEGVLA
ncbi:hypothetical protein DY000_02035376 [Brassica cretica]|uniref:Uncharacterized protein n=1 Tax=Brassica cretica TaxID=69181 RepID=A0ABQ7DR11_BRACR|nr:hypothetical protein DY000_02035376 [Brassica cretica]